MWEIKISPSTKKGRFLPFVAKYKSKKEAEQNAARQTLNTLRRGEDF